MKTVLFAYTRSATRAVTAAAIFNQLADHNLAKAIAAYLIEPVQVSIGWVATMYAAHALDVFAVANLQELTFQLAEQSDVLILLDDASAVRCLPPVPQEDWSPADPGLLAEGSEPHVLYDELEPRAWKLIAQRGWWKPGILTLPAPSGLSGPVATLAKGKRRGLSGHERRVFRLSPVLRGKEPGGHDGETRRDA